MSRQTRWMGCAALTLGVLGACGDKGKGVGAEPAPAKAALEAPSAPTTPPERTSKTADTDHADPVETAVKPPDDKAFAGVEMTVNVGTKSETLTLSEAILTARGQGPIAAWSCIPALGTVQITDFLIGDDPKKKGELFVVHVKPVGFGQVRPGVATGAKIDLRRAGESGLTTFRGTLTWDNDFQGGRASTGEGSDVPVEVRWKCLPKTP
jgi:hypothetical protein